MNGGATAHGPFMIDATLEFSLNLSQRYVIFFYITILITIYTKKSKLIRIKIMMKIQL